MTNEKIYVIYNYVNDFIFEAFIFLVKNVIDYIFKNYERRSVVNIAEIAKLANVSSATVSRVINNSDKVSEKTKKRINEIIKKYGYEPNLLGRHLRTKETKLILVIMTTIANSFFSRVIDGIDREAHKYGYSIMLCITNDNRQSEQNYLNLMRNGVADGAIIMNTTMTSEEMHEFAKKYNVVQCSEYIDPDSYFVAIDNVKAAYDATEYHIKSGRRRIAYCGVVNHFISSSKRYHGYVKALTDNGIEPDRRIIFDGNYGFRSAYKLTSELLSRGEKFDALFAISDRMAIGAINSIKAFGLKVPDDVAVIGFDDIDLAHMTEPQLSTVSQPKKDLGREAFKMLYMRLKGEKITERKKILKHKLILRDSTINNFKEDI